MWYMRIVNRSERLINFPPLTRWPEGARSIRQPGESASQMLLADGSQATPVRAYTAIACPPGVTSNQPGREGEDPIPLSESHDAWYWDQIVPKSQKLVDFGMIQFKRDDEEKDTDEQRLEAEMGSNAQGLADLSGKSDGIALQFVTIEDDLPTLKRWLAAEKRSRVRKALRERIQERGGGKAA
jgi:hypothetical protein